MKPAPHMMEIAVSRKAIEDIINYSVTQYLQASGSIRPGEEVDVTLPVGETFMLPIKLHKEFHEGRMVCETL